MSGSAFERQPLPIARSLRRYRNATEGRERHDAAYFLFEVYLKYLAAVAIAHYLAGEERDHRVNAVLKGLARPSLGEWLRFLRECLRFLAGQTDPDPAPRALWEVLERKEGRWKEVVRLLNALRAFRTGEESRKEQVSLEMLLEEIVSYRNRVLGHGAPLAADHYLRFADLLGPAFEDLLRESPFLTAFRLVSFPSIRLEGGSTLLCEVVEFMGLEPLRRDPPLALPYGAVAPAKDRLHLLHGDGKFISLDPLLLAYREDVYILNEAEGTPEYLSYASGERYRPADLADSQREVFGRILGYQVDPQRLSRIGEDLRPAGEPGTEPAGKGADGLERLGDFRIVREVGRGAMGAVFEAVQESLGRRVALKVLPGSFALDPRRLERFRREARATARVHHRSIVPVYDVGEAGGTHYYAMEFIAGRSLDRLIAEAREKAPRAPRRGSSSASDPGYIARAVEEMAAVAEGLEEAHRLGLIHRDVKPSNILVDADGRYVLVDFGLVHEVEAETLTRSGEMVGTLAYMSPEQVSRSRVDARSDVYGLGATLYEVLTLEAPFPEGDDHGVQRAILFEEPVPPRKRNPRLNRDLETVILHAIEKNPERRYASAGALAADLRRILRFEPVQAKATSGWTRLSRRIARHRGKVAAGGVIAVLVLLLGFVLHRSGREESLRRVAEYEPRVLRAVLKLERGQLTLKASSGEPAAIDAQGLFARRDAQVIASKDGRSPLEEAVDELREAESDLPGRPDAYFHRARGLQLLGREEEALGELARALENVPDFAPARVLRARILEKRGEGEPAKKDIELASRSTQSAWAIAWFAAHRALDEGHWTEAQEAFGKLIEIESAVGEPYLGASIESRLGRGVARLEGRDFNGAIEDFLRAMAVSQDALEPGLLLGKAYYLKGEPEQAERTFEEIHRRSPLPDEAALGAAAIYSSLEDYEKGLAWAERVKVESIRERNRSALLRALLRFPDARKAAERAVGLNPGDALAQDNLGSTLVAMDKNEEAIAVFKKAIEIDPLDSGAHWSLGEALLSKGNAAEAIPVLKKAEELDPRDPLPPVILARAFASLQNYPEAFSSSRRSLELGPRTWSEDSFVLLDQLFRQTSDSPLPPESVDRMIEALEKALEAGGTNSAFLLAGLALAWIDHPSRKDPVRACDCALRAAKASRGVNPWIILTLSRIEFEAGKTRDAILRLEEASRVSEWDTGDWFDFSRMLGDLLERYRNALLPGFGSFASIDDAVSRSEEEVLVPEGASWSFFRGRAEPSAGMEWTATDFDDSAWEKGAGGFGYQDGDDATVLTDMKGNYTTVYIRNVFTMPEAAPYQRCRLSVKADDGFVAYLNGVEVARARAGSRGRRMAFDAVATQSADEPLVPVQVELEVGRFREGRNCLAIQGLNQARDSSDFSLIPVLLGESRTDPGRIHMLLAKFRGVAAGEDSKGLLAYFEGRILEREGKHREAIAFFSEAEALAPSRPEPVLQGAECLRALKDPAAAERKLREAIEKGMEDRRLWDLWIEISFLDLGRAPGEVLKAFPRGNPDTRGEDFRWLLKRLSAGEAIRLVSGGEDYRSPQGISWSRDRFFRGGLSYLPFMTKRVRYPGSIRNTEDATLYRSERFFFGSGPVGYRVPLPSGSYRVTLHFAEIFYWEPGKRVFDVLLEGKEVLRDYDPFSAVGFAAADRKTFLLRVEDGFLDLEFVREAGNPKISALEIERVE